MLLSAYIQGYYNFAGKDVTVYLVAGKEALLEALLTPRSDKHTLEPPEHAQGEQVHTVTGGLGFTGTQTPVNRGSRSGWREEGLETKESLSQGLLPQVEGHSSDAPILLFLPPGKARARCGLPIRSLSPGEVSWEIIQNFRKGLP